MFCCEHVLTAAEQAVWKFGNFFEAPDYNQWGWLV